MMRALLAAKRGPNVPLFTFGTAGVVHRVESTEPCVHRTNERVSCLADVDLVLATAVRLEFKSADNPCC